MKLYIASRFSNKPMIRLLIAALPPTFVIVSTWHDLEDIADGTRMDAVQRDLRELDLCDAVLLCTDNCEAVPGGMHFEAGYAYAQGKKFFLLGPAVNIFCDLAETWLGKGTLSAEIYMRGKENAR